MNAGAPRLDPAPTGPATRSAAAATRSTGSTQARVRRTTVIRTALLLRIRAARRDGSGLPRESPAGVGRVVCRRRVALGSRVTRKRSACDRTRNRERGKGAPSDLCSCSRGSDGGGGPGRRRRLSDVPRRAAALRLHPLRRRSCRHPEGRDTEPVPAPGGHHQRRGHDHVLERELPHRQLRPEAAGADPAVEGQVRRSRRRRRGPVLVRRAAQVHLQPVRLRPVRPEDGLGLDGDLERRALARRPEGEAGDLHLHASRRRGSTPSSARSTRA